VTIICFVNREIIYGMRYPQKAARNDLGTYHTVKTNGSRKNGKSHEWWEPWKNSLRLINSVAADSSAALAVIIVAKVLEYAVNNIEGKQTSHPNASDIVHYANLTVLFGVVGILGYRLLRRLYRDEN
jgi:hypothetical protein